MNIIKTHIDGLIIIEPRIFQDERGCFFESFNQKEFEKKVCKTTFVQDNDSESVYGVIRGLHFQKTPFQQAKLMRFVSGKVLDIALDIRKDSPTFGQHVSIKNSGENRRQPFIPRGFVHGFVVLSESVNFQYKCDSYYFPDSEKVIVWNNPELDIDWRIPPEDIILSNKDRVNVFFRNLHSGF